MTPPRRAVVLAAGRGVRLHPLTWLRPKSMLPLHGKPMLAHALDRLAAWGVREVVVNAHWLAAQVRDFVRDYRGPMTVRVSEEPVLLGTGGALRPLRDWIGTDPFWVVNADIRILQDPAALLRRFSARMSPPLSCLWLTTSRGPRTVLLDGQGQVRSMTGGRPGVDGAATFCGVQIASPRLLDYLPDTAVCSLVDVFRRALDAGERLAGVCAEEDAWDDLGTLRRYREAQTTSRKRNVIWAGGTVTLGSRVRDCVVTDGADVQGKWPHPVAVDALQWPDPALFPLLRRAGWRASECIVAPLPPRGSDRVFLRVGCGTRRAIYLRYGGARPENERYAAHAMRLRACGLPVPAVLASDAVLRGILMEDVGDQTLGTDSLDGICAKTAYAAVVRSLARLHTRATVAARREDWPLEPAFDESLYAVERQLFFQELLQNRYGQSPDPIVSRMLETVAVRLCREPRVLLHRDMQSSNILLFRGRPRWIDFQGMRLGPAAYDLASLLYDPYVEISPALRRALLHEYVRHAPPETVGNVRATLPWAAVQRLMQALGAYGRLSAAPTTRRFAVFIPVAARRLARVAQATGLTAVHTLARQIVQWEAAVQKGCGSRGYPGLNRSASDEVLIRGLGHSPVASTDRNQVRFSQLALGRFGFGGSE